MTRKVTISVPEQLWEIAERKSRLSLYPTISAYIQDLIRKDATMTLADNSGQPDNPYSDLEKQVIAGDTGKDLKNPKQSKRSPVGS